MRLNIDLDSAPWRRRRETVHWMQIWNNCVVISWSRKAARAWINFYSVVTMSPIRSWRSKRRHAVSSLSRAFWIRQQGKLATHSGTFCGCIQVTSVLKSCYFAPKRTALEPLPNGRDQNAIKTALGIHIHLPWKPALESWSSLLACSRYVDSAAQRKNVDHIPASEKRNEFCEWFRKYYLHFRVSWTAKRMQSSWKHENCTAVQLFPRKADRLPTVNLYYSTVACSGAHMLAIFDSVH